MTVKITLACTECKQRNYNTTKNKKNILSASYRSGCIMQGFPFHRYGIRFP